MGTHKILVNGTAFAVTAGTELINGTICKTGGGRTLVNGTAFEVKFSRSITVTIHGSGQPTTGTYVQIGDLKVKGFGTYETTPGTEITAVAAANYDFTRDLTQIYYNDVSVSQGTERNNAQYSFIAKGNVDILIRTGTGNYAYDTMRITES